MQLPSHCHDLIGYGAGAEVGEGRSPVVAIMAGVVVLTTVAVVAVVTVVIAMVTVRMDLMQRLDDDGAEPDAEVCAGHVHQTKSGHFLVAMHTHL